MIPKPVAGLIVAILGALINGPLFDASPIVYSVPSAAKSSPDVKSAKSRPVPIFVTAPVAVFTV